MSGVPATVAGRQAWAAGGELQGKEAWRAGKRERRGVFFGGK